MVLITEGKSYYLHLIMGVFDGIKKRTWNPWQLQEKRESLIYS